MSQIEDEPNVGKRIGGVVLGATALIIIVSLWAEASQRASRVNSSQPPQTPVPDATPYVSQEAPVEIHPPKMLEALSWCDDKLGFFVRVTSRVPKPRDLTLMNFLEISKDPARNQRQAESRILDILSGLEGEPDTRYYSNTFTPKNRYNVGSDFKVEGNFRLSVYEGKLYTAENRRFVQFVKSVAETSLRVSSCPGPNPEWKVN